MNATFLNDYMLFSEGKDMTNMKWINMKIEIVQVGLKFDNIWTFHF